MNMLKFCWKYLRKMQGMFFLYLFLSLLTSAIGLTIPLISGTLITNLTSGKDQRLLFVHSGLFILLTLGNMGIGFISNYLYIHIQAKSGYSLNVDIIRHVQQLSLSYFTKMDTAYLSNRINNDSNDILIFCISSIIGIVSNGMSIIFSIIILLSIHQSLTFLLFALLLLYILLYKLFKRRLYEKNLQVKESQSLFFSHLLEQLSQIRFIKTHSVAKSFLKKLDDSFQFMFHLLLSSQKLNFLFSSADASVRMLAQVGIFILGGLSVINGNITIGLFSVIISYFNMMLGSGQYFFHLGSSYQSTLVSYDRIQTILREPLQKDGERELSNIHCITINHLNFYYDNKPVFTDFSYQFKKGNTYAIIGHNGAGKTTLVHLLLGLYQDEYQGEILYNNYELHELKMSSIRWKNIGITEQEPILLADTVKNNFYLGLDEKKSDISEFCKVLNMEKYLHDLSNGLSTMINDKSSNLSGGEKQKISIIRQFIKDPDIMIFDEPTSAMDHSSRLSFLNYLDNIKKNKIILMISHEPEIIQFCDYCIRISQ